MSSGYPDLVPPRPSLAQQTIGCGPFLTAAQNEHVPAGPAISYLAKAENNLKFGDQAGDCDSRRAIRGSKLVRADLTHLCITPPAIQLAGSISHSTRALLAKPILRTCSRHQLRVQIQARSPRLRPQIAATSSPFVVGQKASWKVTVTNSGSSLRPAPSRSRPLPRQGRTNLVAYLSLAESGTGWTCSGGACSTATVLSPGQSLATNHRDVPGLTAQDAQNAADGTQVTHQASLTTPPMVGSTVRVQLRPRRLSPLAPSFICSPDRRYEFSVRCWPEGLPGRSRSPTAGSCFDRHHHGLDLCRAGSNEPGGYLSLAESGTG